MRCSLLLKLIPVFIFWVFFAFPGMPLCDEKPLTQVISTGPSWNTFTNRDGTGLYHEILSDIFTPLGINVTHKYTNATRGIHLVAKELADFYICKTRNFDFSNLMVARQPMYAGTFYAIFKKKNIKDWQGPSSLTGRMVVWRRGYYKQSEFKFPFTLLETDTGDSALNQIILDRGDLYIDDLNLIKESIAATKLSFKMKAYQIEPVGKRTYHPVFKRSDRGKTILMIYDRGIKQLHESGALKKIFHKWNHPYPGYDSH